jgi:methyltransferase family protein
VAFDPSSKNRLTVHDLGRFPGDGLLDRLGRAVSAAGCLPRKELYEAWETARRVRRRFRGGRVVDVAGGHGLLAFVMLLLDRTSGDAVVVDPAPPHSAAALHDALRAAWPEVRPVRHAGVDVDQFPITPDDVVVSCHACGSLTDRVLDAASAARARVAVVPCCHDFGDERPASLDGWLAPALAIDVRRVVDLERRGYTVWTSTIPDAVTPKNRLLMGAPQLAQG